MQRFCISALFLFRNTSIVCCLRLHNATKKHKCENVSFHCFPKDPDFRRQWILAMKRKILTAVNLLTYLTYVQSCNRAGRPEPGRGPKLKLRTGPELEFKIAGRAPGLSLILRAGPGPELKIEPGLRLGPTGRV